MVPLFIFDFVDHQCFHEYFIGKKRSFHSFKVEVALLRYIVFYCELGCDTSEPHVSYISRACSSLVRQPYYIQNRFILKIRGLVVVLTVRKVHWAGRAFYIDEYTLIFLFSQCMRCAQKRDCWESVRFASERSRVRIPPGPPKQSQTNQAGSPGFCSAPTVYMTGGIFVLVFPLAYAKK